METLFRKTVLQEEIGTLLAFDRKIFPKADLFTREDWRLYESHWMIVSGNTVGCCAFQLNVNFEEDIRADGDNPPMNGSLYIASTGILPSLQGQGLGTLFKSWQIAYAKHLGFNRIVTNMRSQNLQMILLNHQFGFRAIRTTPKYYRGPIDATVVMERIL